jgi:hypothetical protein
MPTKYYLGTIERRGSWLGSVKYVMFSEKRTFVRTVHEDELIKLHGISAWWFHIGREIYLARESFPDYDSEAVKDFKKKFSTPENVLVYLPNNYLQRLYFFVPKDAISW